jgi:hypothetical protein
MTPGARTRCARPPGWPVGAPPSRRGPTWAGVRSLATVRELALPLPLSSEGVAWAGDTFCGLPHLTRLSLSNSARGLAAVHGPAGLFAPGSLPRSLRHVALHRLALVWPPGVEPDAGAALLRPLAGVPDVSLSRCFGLGDGGLRTLAGATRLAVADCDEVAGEHLGPLGRALEELAVKACDAFTGGGLGSLVALRRLVVERCYAFRAGTLVDVAAGCAVLERVDATWTHNLTLDVAAAEAALLAAAGGGGSWAFSRKLQAWAAKRCPQQAAPAAGNAGGAPVAAAPAPAPAGGAAAGSAGDVAATAVPVAAAALPDDTAPPPARRQRVGE